MNNEYKYKVGDKVYLAHDPTISAIVTEVCQEGKYDYYVKPEEDGFESGWQEYELLDAKTAFLTRLQSLLREFDAEIEINPYYETAACLSLWLNKECAFKNKEARMITADNIMSFDKE